MSANRSKDRSSLCSFMFVDCRHRPVSSRAQRRIRFCRRSGGSSDPPARWPRAPFPAALCPPAISAPRSDGSSPLSPRAKSNPKPPPPSPTVLSPRVPKEDHTGGWRRHIEMSFSLLESRRRTKAGVDASVSAGSMLQSIFYDCRLELRLAFKRRRIGPQLTTFRINTCKSVSKQRTLAPFRMNTCEKPGGGGGLSLRLVRLPRMWIISGWPVIRPSEIRNEADSPLKPSQRF